MANDELTMEGPKASAAVQLTYLSKKIQASS